MSIHWEDYQYQVEKIGWAEAQDYRQILLKECFEENFDIYINGRDVYHPYWECLICNHRSYNYHDMKDHLKQEHIEEIYDNES